MAKTKYDCLKCIGLCCSVYETVPVTKRDIKRLAKYFGLSVETTEKKYTKIKKGQRVLRRKRDPLLNETCIMHDLDKRLCGIYEARPRVCRIWPEHGDGSCVYYNLLEFERRQQGTDVVMLIQIKPSKS